jgi:protein-S-isoprenylcysteine O-methyltransferase Ste14
MGVVAAVPLPEQHVQAVAAGLALHRLRPWRLPGDGRVRALGCLAVTAGVAVNVWAMTSRGSGDLERPERLVVSGAYSLTRNPMYLGWALLNVGIGTATRSGWVLAALPVALARIHRDILREEATLAELFGVDYERYRSSVPRYLPLAMR